MFWRGRFVGICEHSRLRDCEPFRQIRTRGRGFRSCGSDPISHRGEMGKRRARGNLPKVSPGTPSSRPRGPRPPLDPPFGRRTGDSQIIPHLYIPRTPKHDPAERSCFGEDVLAESFRCRPLGRHLTFCRIRTSEPFRQIRTTKNDPSAPRCGIPPGNRPRRCPRWYIPCCRR